MSSHGIPEVLMKKVDDYVDSLAPQIQPRITAELDEFQQQTIDVLEAQVVDAFRSLFDRDRDSHAGAGRGLDDAIPNDYGRQSLPFANEIAGLTRSFSKIADETGDDLRDILDLTEGRGGSGGARSVGEDHADPSQRVRGFFSAAVNAVQDHLESSGGTGGPGGERFELDGLLGVLSSSVKDVARSPEDTARRISPEIKDRIGAKLREQHAPIAEQFTRIALEHIKRWLRGNTSTRDIGDGARGEIEDHVKDLVKGIGGLFGSRHHGEGSSRGLGDHDRGDGDGGDGGGEKSSGGGFSRVISEKLSTGLGRVHRDVRLEFRKALGGIEKQLFELLPDELQGPLEKILGGNPFDSQLEREAGAGAQTDRGFRDDIKAKLVNKIRGLVRKVQEMVRESILGVVNGGHRKFERASWVFVQNMVEQKVQKYLPKVKITVPDDIGNEGVDLGAPKPSAQPGHDSQPAPPPSYEHQQEHHQTNYHQGQHQPIPEYRPDQYQPPHPPSDQHQPQSYQLQAYQPQSYQPQSYQPQSYQPQSYQPQAYQQGQGHQDNDPHGQNPPY
ncbi:putative C6 zinc finger domain-containing protein [Rosellinia necatrix]|uniref:Putative C6 zinc finger domain-containing protein n=1 Tax=Rosellinia necatrix TaxID=77044 RepID=A0A1S7UKZ2_ROSNE|nr:putative C6 zinc finger domain-containing protein [Rosellinia necatrix]